MLDKLLFLLALVSLTSGQGTYDADLIKNLPGVTFDYNFRQWSGYVKAKSNPDHYFHYWLVESQNDPENDPLVLWFNGGPGCSSLGGFMTENGPFHPNRDGKTLFENIYSWNKIANLFFIEMPVGVGFSYAADGNITSSDETTRDDTFTSLVSFFDKFPKYKNKPFFITGESYNGVYIPMLAAKITTEYNAGRFPTHLTGVAIGNGYFSHKWDHNSLIPYFYLHGQIGHEAYHDVNTQCCDSVTAMGTCDFSKYVTPLKTTGDDQSDGSSCGNMVMKYSTDLEDSQDDPYNIYQSCLDGVDHLYV